MCNVKIIWRDGLLIRETKYSNVLQIVNSNSNLVVCLKSVDECGFSETATFSFNEIVSIVIE